MSDVAQKMLHRIEKSLKIGGGLYSIEDVIDGLKSGDMQMLSHGDSLLITQVGVFPQKRIIQTVAIAGRREDLDGLYRRMVQFAEEVGASQIYFNGRPGWKRWVGRWGFKPVATAFMLEL